MPKSIPLSQGKFALVDDEDYEYLNQWKWYYHQGYAIRTFGKAKLRMHRLICNPPKGMQPDHINHDTLDNRRSNLRICTGQENRRNTPPSKVNTSGFLGIRKHRNKWQARTEIHDEILFIGSFNTPEEAARAYDKKIRELFGEFAYVNFPNGV